MPNLIAYAIARALETLRGQTVIKLDLIYIAK